MRQRSVHAFRAAALGSILPLVTLSLLHCTMDSSPTTNRAIGHSPSATPDASTLASVDGSSGVDDGDASAPGSPSDDGSTSTPPAPTQDGAAPLGRLVAYASGYAAPIDAYTVDESSGALTLAPSAGVTSFGTQMPSFLAVNPSATTLYAVDEDTSGQVGAYSIAPTTGALTFLNAVSSGGNGPPFVRVDATGKWVFVANYGDGTVSVLPVLAGGKLGGPLSTVLVGTNAHMMIPDPTNHFVFVPCLGKDYVAQFLFDDSTGALKPNTPATVGTLADAGPRHLAFHPNGKLAYLINETNSTMTAFSFDSTAGTLTEIETQPTRAAGATGTNTAAEVWVHPSGSWLFGSNRGDNTIVVFALDPTTGKMTFKGTTPSGGVSPRDFTLSPKGDFLYAANETSNNVVSFKFDATQGTLTAVGTPLTVTAASFIGLFRLPAP